MLVSSHYIYALSFLCWIVVLVFAPFAAKHANPRLWSALIGVGAFILLAASLTHFRYHAANIALPLPLYLGQVGFMIHMDPLARWFLIAIAIVSGAVSFYLPSYMDHLKDRSDMRVFWAALPLLLLSMCAVTLAANVQSFLVAWELMSLSSCVLVATSHYQSTTRQAALIYLGATRVGTAFLAGGFLWAHALAGSWTFQQWHLTGSAALGPGILILTGLGVKAGMWPFHLWLPIAHPAAPSPVSALMSGVMVKIALYMMIRLFLISPAFHNIDFGYTLLILGSISAVWGVLFALLQEDMKRILAYSTVENVGLILIGIGGAISASCLGLAAQAQLAASAALFLIMSHALYKSLLFLGAGSIDYSTHTLNLGRLGGLAKRMPATFGLMLMGSAAICGLPPLNGFASEWLLYQASLKVAIGVGIPLLRFCGLLMVGWISLVGTLAAACFIRLLGVAFLGRPRYSDAENAVEIGRGMITAKLILGLGCVGMGLLVPQVLTQIQCIVVGLAPAQQSLSSVWNLPISTIVILLIILIMCGVLWMEQAARKMPVKTYITWECGFGDLTSRMQITAASFSQPIARMFGGLYHYAIQLHIEGADRRLFPEKVRSESTSVSILESRVYRPIIRLVNRAGDLVLKLQAGSIHIYLLMMFATLLLLLVVVGQTK